MRTVFLGSPPFATQVLAALIAGRHRPVAVVTPPDKPRGRGRSVAESEVAALAREHEVPLLRPESARDPDFLAELRALRPDVLMVASYGEILTRDVFELPPHGCLNVHASLLPRWRGASPVQAAILAGDRVSGVTIQRVVRALDAGDVLLALETPIGPEETGGELFERLARLGGEAAVRALDLVAAGEATFTPQDPARVTVCRKLRKEHGRIDWTRSAAELARQVRALNPWPSARTVLPDGRGLTVLRAAAREVEREGAQPGTLLDEPGAFPVATGDGALLLLEVQPSGKQAMAAADFLRGALLAPGARLED